MTYHTVRQARRKLKGVKNICEFFQPFSNELAGFFLAEAHLNVCTPELMKDLKISSEQLIQQVIFLNDRSAAVVFGDSNVKDLHFLCILNRSHLPFAKLERKLLASASSLLTSYLTRFKKVNEYLRIVPQLIDNFRKAVIAHMLVTSRYSLEHSIDLLSTFERLVLWNYENDVVETGVMFSRNYWFIKSNSKDLGIDLIPLEGIGFNQDLLSTKRGIMLVNGRSSLMMIDRKNNIRALVSGSLDEANQTEHDFIPSPLPSWMCSVVKGGDFIVRSTMHRELEVSSRFRDVIRFKRGVWIVEPWESFLAEFKRIFIDPALAVLVFKLLKRLFRSRKGALLVFLQKNEDFKSVVESDRSFVDFSLPESVSLKNSPLNILQRLAEVDGAMVFDMNGLLLASGARIRSSSSGEAVEGTRTFAAINASNYGASVKISHDGGFSLYSGGKKLFATP